MIIRLACIPLKKQAVTVANVFIGITTSSFQYVGSLRLAPQELEAFEAVILRSARTKQNVSNDDASSDCIITDYWLSNDLGAD